MSRGPPTWLEGCRRGPGLLCPPDAPDSSQAGSTPILVTEPQSLPQHRPHREPLLSGMGKEVGNLLLENSQLLETK